MNANAKLSESHLATGIKTAAVVAIVGLVAVLAQPTRMPDELFHAQQAVTHASAAPATAGETPYFPAQYPAPTTHADDSPTF